MSSSILSPFSALAASASRLIPACRPALRPLDQPRHTAAHISHTRYGRGQGSTKGGTAGRGHKGQKARSGNGKPVPGYEGGQTPIHRLFPKRGFVNFNSRTYAPLPLSRLQQYLASGRLDPTLPIGIGEIVRSNLIHGISGFSGVKLLGELDTSLPLPPLELNLSRFSKSAAAAVIEAGGKITAVYHNRLGLRQEVWPEKFVGREVEAARPIRKSDIRR
ncbi:YmL10 [Saitozyma podzolica]|uniref:YmL10 n=1 Tax=Saitozyma podzolica TaxID=1890683 RepID=A0A427YKU7_9TREE|nr:YmL10 [Saitozyma podzolica]